jgi:lipid II:glycine glycyltransferase (peptidoglycan interpeptide bridge formation enzyme)
MIVNEVKNGHAHVFCPLRSSDTYYMVVTSVPVMFVVHQSHPHYFFEQMLQLVEARHDLHPPHHKYQSNQTFSNDQENKRQDLNKKMTNRLLVMVSNNSLSLKSATDQRRAMTLLASNKIPYELLDGMDPARKER